MKNEKSSTPPQANKTIFLKGDHFDYETLFYVIFLVLFGILMVYSASSFTAYNMYGKSSYFAIRQFRAALIGFIGMYVASKLRYQFLKKWAKLLMLISIILLLLVLIVGSVRNGSARWIQLGPLSFQPSELAKLSLILYMAHICTARFNDLETLQGTLKIFIYPGIMIILIAVENLSTALICGAIAIFIWLIVTPKPRYFFLAIVAGAILFFAMLALKGYRSERIYAWRHPESSDKGYQTMQALYAIGSGGWFGKGLGQSIQKRGFIPEAQNDMIFSIVCEELGIVGAFCVILVFIFLLWRLKTIANCTNDLFGSLIIVGVISHIACQAILNMFVVTNIFPNTGVTLPFISYGGTSLSMLLLEMGIVLSVSRQIPTDFSSLT